MVVEETSQEQAEPKRKEGKFRKSPILARRTFIIGIMALSLFLIYSSIITILQRGIIVSIVFYSLFLVLALSGLIVGVFSFRHGKNIFGIIGFILSLISVATIPWSLQLMILLLIQYPF